MNVCVLKLYITKTRCKVFEEKNWTKKRIARHNKKKVAEIKKKNVDRVRSIAPSPPLLLDAGRRSSFQTPPREEEERPFVRREGEEKKSILGGSERNFRGR